jgi:hypothetical protein
MMKKEIKTDKIKLIDANENKEEAFIHKINFNPLLERAKERSKTNEIFVNRSNKYINDTPSRKDIYYNKYVL